MGITKQDIRNMFNKNFKNLLNEEQISGVVDILYNSPTARNNLQRMKEYNDSRRLNGKGSIVLRDDIGGARADNLGEGRAGRIAINPSLLYGDGLANKREKLSVLIAREAGAFNLDDPFPMPTNSSIGKLLEDRSRIEGAQTEAQRKAESEIGVRINNGTSARDLIDEMNDPNSLLSKQRNNNIDSYYLNVGNRYINNTSEEVGGQTMARALIYDRIINGYLDDARIQNSYAQKNGDKPFFDNNRLEDIKNRRHLGNSDIIDNRDGSYEINLRDSNGNLIGNIKARDNETGKGVKELTYTDSNIDGTNSNGVEITIKSNPATGHFSEVTIIDNNKHTVETIHFDENNFFGKKPGVDNFSPTPRENDYKYPKINKREYIDYSHLLDDALIKRTVTTYDENGKPKSETSQISLSDIGDAIGKVLPDFLKKPSTWGHLLTGNWTGLLREMFFHQIDPLALDLNGNGIETLAANGHDGALFDHERLGIRTATGWIHSNDGILVYDRNGDGKINDGGEIFGDNTLLKNGKTAAHGFEAAAELDDNGDGKLDAADGAFGKLGVWRDLNHNGISEEGEIFALKELRIKSLNLGYTQADKDLGNGNTLAEVGSYTDEDGNEHIMGDLHLAADRLHSRYSNSIPLTDEQQQEVNLRGSGRLRDLREAAAQSSELAEVLQQYKNAASKEEQLALRHKLLKAWADTDPQRIKDFFASALMMQSEGRQGIGLTPSQVKHMGEIVVMGFWDLIGQPDPER